MATPGNPGSARTFTFIMLFDVFHVVNEIAAFKDCKTWTFLNINVLPM